MHAELYKMRHTFQVLSNKELALPIYCLPVAVNKMLWSSSYGWESGEDWAKFCLFVLYGVPVLLLASRELQASGVFRLLISTALCVKQRSQKALYWPIKSQFYSYLRMTTVPVTGLIFFSLFSWLSFFTSNFFYCRKRKGKPNIMTLFFSCGLTILFGTEWKRNVQCVQEAREESIVFQYFLVGFFFFLSISIF